MQQRSNLVPKIQEVHEFHARRAAIELIKFGFTAVDDIGRILIRSAAGELSEELGFVADAMDLKRDEIDTNLGPVFVFRDRRKMTLKAAKEWVMGQSLLPKEEKRAG